MSLRRSKLLRRMFSACKSLKKDPIEVLSFFSNQQRRYINIHEKASGQIQVGVLGAPIQSGQVRVIFSALVAQEFFQSEK